MAKFITLLFFCFLLATPTVYSAAGGGGGGGGTRGGGHSSKASAASKSPMQLARANYAKGIKYRDKAWQYEEKAAALTDEKKIKKLEKKANKQYVKAIKYYRKAIENVPGFYQVHSSLGYALRKTGDIEASLTAYDKSIEINPVYPEAIEYRAETYLQMNRFEDVKTVYMELFEDLPREYADQLMEAMQKWDKQSDQVSTEGAQNFSTWIKERQEIANNTLSLHQTQSTNWDDKI